MSLNSNQIKNSNFESTPLQEVKYIPSGQDNHKLEAQNEVRRSDTLYLLFSVITGLLLMGAGGTSLVWFSPAILKLKSNDTYVNPLGRPITTIEISQLMGIPTFIGLLGSLFLPSLADKIGRKKSLQLMGVGMFVGGIGLAFSKSVPLMVAGASALGIFFGAVLAIISIYLTEICEDHNRAKYGCIMSGFLPVGQLYTYIIGPLFGLRDFTLLLSAPLIIFLIFFFFAPESPVYLLSKGRKDECLQTLRKLRSNKTESEIDIDYYKISQSLSGSQDKKRAKFYTVFKSQEGRTGIYLALLPLLSQYFCGVPILMPLMAPIFNEAGVSLSGSVVAIIVGSFKVCSYTFTSLIVEKTGRKSMLLLSAAGMSLPISTLGLFFYLKHINSPLVNSLQWLPVASILAYIFLYSLGLGPLPIAIMSELFTSDVRSSAIAFVTTFAAALLSIYLFCFPLLKDLVGTHFCLWIFGATNLLSAILFYFYLPETKGKSVHEIQKMLTNY